MSRTDPQPTPDAREQALAARLAQARAEDRAPERLRARVDALRAGGARPAPRRRTGSWPVAVGGLAALILVLALAVPAGTPGAPSVSQAAALAAGGPTGAAPAADPASNGAFLRVRVQNLAFPNWTASFGWRATGERHDRLGGREVVTVYYARGRSTIAYTIISAPPLASPATRAQPDGPYLFHTTRFAGRTVVSWHQAGHTCILSAAAGDAGTMRSLAAWKS